jgi:predicted dehydrogenase
LSFALKIGLIGCGRAAELIYLPALKRFPDIEITAVIDPIKERRELFSEKFNKCFQHSSLDENFISRIDAAIISSSPDTHITLASTLLKNNKYVLVEKPLALSMNGIKDLIKIESWF